MLQGLELKTVRTEGSGAMIDMQSAALGGAQCSATGGTGPSNAEIRFRAAYAAARREAFRSNAIGLLLLVIAIGVSVYQTHLWTVNFWQGLPKLGDYIVKTLPTLRLATFGSDLAAWFYAWKIWLGLLIETIMIALFATALSVVGALCLAFPAARNLGAPTWLGFLLRRAFEIARTVPEIVWALTFVFAFRVGPLAGVFAIAIHSTGALGKLYTEVIENANLKPWEGMVSAGAGWWQAVRYAIVPQVLPNVASYTLLRFEVNVRSSSIIGYVGAGGLGQEIRHVISFQEYESISALFVIIVVTVMIIDWSCERLRHRIIGFEGGRA
jgi:phosphonate transport system permease protein